MRWFPTFFAPLAALLPPSIGAVELDALSSYPRFEFAISHHGGGDESARVSCTWGMPDRGVDLKDVALTLDPGGGGDDPEPVVIDERGRDDLFRALAKAVTGYGLPPSRGERGGEGECLTIELGSPVCQILLTFPARSPGHWNRALGLWEEFRRALPEEDRGDLPDLARLEGGGGDRGGMGPIAEYLALEAMVTYISMEETHYENLNFEWRRADDGEISFDTSWSPRTGDSLRAEPEPKHIRPLFEAIKTATTAYRYPRSAVSAPLDDGRLVKEGKLIEVMIKGADGWNQWVFVEGDRAGWAKAEALWEVARELYPAEQRERIADP